MPSCLIANQSEFSSNSIRCLRAISSGHEHLAALAHGLLANAQSQPVVVRINGGTRGIIAMPIFNRTPSHQLRAAGGCVSSTAMNDRELFPVCKPQELWQQLSIRTAPDNARLLSIEIVDHLHTKLAAARQ